MPSGHVTFHLNAAPTAPPRSPGGSPRDTLWGLRPRGPADIRVRFRSADGSSETVLSHETHLALTILLTMRPDLRSGGAQPVEDEHLRLWAANQLQATWLRNPIPRQRRPYVVPVLKWEAATRGQSAATLRRELTVQGIFEALADVPRNENLEELLKALRRQVADAVCDILLRPGWRRRERGREVPLSLAQSAADPTDEFAAVDEREALDRLVEQAGLTPRETEVFRLTELECDTTEMAEALGIEPSTVRVHRKNLKDKLSAVRSKI